MTEDFDSISLSGYGPYEYGYRVKTFFLWNRFKSGRHAGRNAGLFIAFELTDKTVVNSVLLIPYYLELVWQNHFIDFFFNLQRKLT